MTRQAEPEHTIVDLSQSIGEAFGEGIAEGLQSALGGLSEALQPLVDEVLRALRSEALAARPLAPARVASLRAVPQYQTSEADERLAAIARAESAHPCEVEGCGESAVARNLCRRHYARRLYQERRERLGANTFRVVQPAAYGGNPVAEKRPAVPVGPIVRRKREDTPAAAAAPVAVAAPAVPAPAPPVLKPVPVASEIVPSPIAAAAAANGITPESVARFLFGGGKG